jgi:hypothetical protein
LLARGLGIGTGTFQPTFRVNAAYQRNVREKVDFTVGRDFNVALRVAVIGQFLNHHGFNLPFVQRGSFVPCCDYMIPQNDDKVKHYF